MQYRVFFSKITVAAAVTVAMLSHNNIRDANGQAVQTSTPSPEDMAASEAALKRAAWARSLVGKNSIYPCDAGERRGYTAATAVTLEPVRNLTKELCVSVPSSVVITKWACEFAKDAQSQFCHGLGNGACDAIGWVWPEAPRVESDGNFNKYCITGHQDLDREWRYFNIHLYNDFIQ